MSIRTELQYLAKEIGGDPLKNSGFEKEAPEPESTADLESVEEDLPQ